MPLRLFHLLISQNEIKMDSGFRRLRRQAAEANISEWHEVRAADAASQ